MYGDYPLYNQLLNPYMPNPTSNPYQQQPKQEVVKVNGENGARAFPIGANSSAILLDESGTIVWLVVTDGAGYKTVSAYDITPHQEEPQPDVSGLEERIQRLEEFVNGFTSDITATTEHTDKQARTDKERNRNA